MNKLESMGFSRPVMALSFARLADATGNSILFIILPLYVGRLSAPWFPFPEPVRVGILLSIFGLTWALLQPVMGTLTDKLGKRKIIIQTGLLIMGCATLAFMFVGSFTGLLILRTIQGIGVALTIPASMAIMALVTRRRTRGGAMGIYSTMRMVGFAVGPLLGGLIVVHFGFNAAFIVGASLIFTGLILVQLWVDEVPVAVSSPGRKSYGIFDRSIYSAGLVAAGLATFVMASAFSMMTTLEKQFNERLHITAIGFSIAFSAVMVSRLIFQIPLGRLSDTLGRKPLMVSGLLLMVPATGFLGVAATTTQLTGLRLLQGIAGAAIASPAFALGADLAKSGGEGRQMSIITMGFGLGIALGPFIAGILDVFFFELPFLIGALMCLIGALVVLFWAPETVDREKNSHNM